MVVKKAVFGLFSLLLSSRLLAADGAIPAENQDQKLKASIVDFDDKAKILLAALQAGTFDAAKDLFFPESAFVLLKAIAKPLDYYHQLTRWYQIDFEREAARFKDRGPLQFKSIKGGSCVWKAANTEANKIPYWSCYRRKIEVSVGDKIETIEVRAMINWGQAWYITHLGPIPKS